MDLFDWLDCIEKGLNSGYTQKDFAKTLSWSEDKLSLYKKIKNLSTDVLMVCKHNQKGRVDSQSTCFDFTEGWFRTSGLYDLNSKYQLKLMESFKTDKFNWNKSKVQSEAKGIYGGVGSL
jgi:hypothetical protein